MLENPIATMFASLACVVLGVAIVAAVLGFLRRKRK